MPAGERTLCLHNPILLSKDDWSASVCVCVRNSCSEDVGGIGAQNSRGAEEAHRALPNEALMVTSGYWD